MRYSLITNNNGVIEMACTSSQELLIDRLQDNGAPIPCDHRGEPDQSYLDSVENADKYIKANSQFMHRQSTDMRADEWGGVYNH
jgi:hypothetical protein